MLFLLCYVMKLKKKTKSKLSSGNIVCSAVKEADRVVGDAARV